MKAQPPHRSPSKRAQRNGPHVSMFTLKNGYQPHAGCAGPLWTPERLPCRPQDPGRSAQDKLDCFEHAARAAHSCHSNLRTQPISISGRTLVGLSIFKPRGRDGQGRLTGRESITTLPPLTVGFLTVRSPRKNAQSQTGDTQQCSNVQAVPSPKPLSCQPHATARTGLVFFPSRQTQMGCRWQCLQEPASSTG